MEISTRKLISNIAKKEDKSACNFLENIKTGAWSPKTRDQYAQYALLAEEFDGILETKWERGQWCSSPPGISILQLLLYQPTVFVDFGAWDSDEFISHYGVDAKQMAKLAEKGFVIPSLYFYNSYKQLIERDPNSAHSYEQTKCDHLRDLLEYKTTKCRIASIRREKLWEALQVDRSDSHIEEMTPIFHDAFSHAKDSQRIEISGQTSVIGGVRKLAENFSYVRALGKGNENVLNWCSELEQGGKTDRIGLVQVARELNGLKSRLASPLTAAYGGVHNLTPYNYKNVNDTARLFGHSIDISDAVDRTSRSSQKFQSKGFQQATELLARLGLGRLMEEAITTNLSLRFPWPPTKTEFESYVSYLEGTRARRVRTARFIDDLRTVAVRTNKETWEEYLQLIRGIESDLQNNKIFRGTRRQSFGATVSVLVKDFSSQFLPGTLPEMVGVGAGVVINALLAAKEDREKGGTDSRYNLISTWNELEQLAPH